MKINLYLDGHSVEINSNIDFVLNKQYTELTDLTSIIVDYSKTIVIPMTPHNNELFNMVYKLQHQVLGNTEYVNYDPTQKIPMVMEYNGSVVMEGYAILNKVDLKNKTYEINLYGQLGKIFNELKNKKFEEYNSTYEVDGEPRENGMFKYVKMCKETIKDSFDTYSSPIWNSTDWKNFFGFAPQMMGDSDFLDTTQYENITAGQVDSEFFQKFEDDTAVASNRKGLLKDGMDINAYGEIRSYTTRPYVYVDKLIQLVQNEINKGDYDGYTMILDPDWFNNLNPYYRNMVYFGSQESMVTDERSFDGTLVFNEVKRNVYTSPTLIVPTVNTSSTTLSSSDYSVNSSTGLVTFPSINTNDTNIVIDGGNVRLIDTWRNTGVSTSDVADLRYAMYNRETSGYPVRYIAIYDANDTLKYRLCLTERRIKDYTYHSSGLSWDYGHSESRDMWAALLKDSKNIVPNTATSHTGYSSINTVVTRTQTFSFPNVILEMSSFKMKFGVMDVSDASGIIYEDNLDMSEMNYYPRLMNAHRGEKRRWDVISGTHLDSIYIPTNVNVSTTTHRSGSMFNIVDALGADFNPFTWMIDYAKKFRMFFYIDYIQKTIFFTSRYFHTGGDVNVSQYGKTIKIAPITHKKVIVDYSKGMTVEPLVNKYKFIEYGYEDNESPKAIQYKKTYGVNYGDFKRDTGVDLNNEVLSFNPDEKESVMIPSITNTLTYRSIMSSASMSTSQLLQTNKVINTLDKDGKIQYFPFFCFRQANKALSYPTGNYNKLRITDDTTYQKGIGKYAYLKYSDTDTVDSVVMTQMPQFDNYYVVDGNIYWSTWTKPAQVYNGYVTEDLESIEVYDRWSDYVEKEIFNINNKKVTCYIRMTYPEFINFKFNQLFEIDGCLFLCNKIVDFNPNSEEPTKVELIQISDPKNLTSGADEPLPEILSDYDRLDYTYDGVGPASITVWSYQGQARLYAPTSDWLHIVQTGIETLPGSSYYKITYRVDVATNMGAERRIMLKSMIEGVPESTCKKEIPVEQDEVDYGLTVSTTSLEFNSGIEEQYVEVRANSPFIGTINNNDVDWITAVPLGPGSVRTFAVSVDENLGFSDRNATIYAQIYDNPSIRIPITIRQAGAIDYGLTVSPSSLSYTSEGGSKSLVATANSPYKPIISESYGWISVTDTTPSSISNKTYNITVSENTSDQSRTATIKALIDGVSGSKVCANITISQEGSPSYELNVNPQTINLNALGERQTLTVGTEQGNWYVVNAPSSWCHITTHPDLHITGATVLAVTADSYIGGTRQTTYTIALRGVDLDEHPEAKKTVTIIQRNTL